jgi:hypothetical protein
MKTTRFAALLIAVNALVVSALPSLADEKSDRALSSQIYNSGKAALSYPDEDERSETLSSERRSASGYYGGYDTTWRGFVSRVRARDYFDFRASDGRTYRVIGEDDNDRFDVTTGQSVEVRGTLTRDVIIASRVRNASSGWGNRGVDFPGWVTSVNGYNRFTVRADNGRTYSIDSRSRLPYSLSAGDYVRIIGTSSYGSVTASQVIILRDDSGYGGGNYGNRAVDFPGTVVSVDRYRNTLSVRGENGITYTVTTNDANRFNVRDVVRVVGYFDGYTVRATSVTRRW